MYNNIIIIRPDKLNYLFLRQFFIQNDTVMRLFYSKLFTQNRQSCAQNECTIAKIMSSFASKQLLSC